MLTVEYSRSIPCSFNLADHVSGMQVMTVAIVGRLTNLLAEWGRYSRSSIVHYSCAYRKYRYVPNVMFLRASAYHSYISSSLTSVMHGNYSRDRILFSLKGRYLGHTLPTLCRLINFFAVGRPLINDQMDVAIHLFQV